MKIERLENSTINNNSITKTTLFNEKDMLIFHINLKPGEEFPCCEHENSSLLMCFIDGNGQILYKDETINISSGTLAYFDETDLFRIRNTGTIPLSCVSIISPRPAIKAQYNELGI